MAMFAYNARQVLFAGLYAEHAADDVACMSQYQISVDTIEPMAGMLTAINERGMVRQVKCQRHRRHSRYLYAKPQNRVM